MDPVFATARQARAVPRACRDACRSTGVGLPVRAAARPPADARRVLSGRVAEAKGRQRATEPGSERVAERIRDVGGWRAETLSRMRTLILEADPEMTEDVKWVKASSPGTPVWSHDGIVCTGEAYAKVVKLTFARGASLTDPTRLFNSSLEGSTRRAIDIHEGEKVAAGAFKALVRAAVAQNAAHAKKR